VGNALARRAACLVVLAAAALGAGACEPRPGKVREQWDESNGSFRVRVQILDEARLAHKFEPSCHLRLLAAAAGSEQFKPFATGYFSRCDQDLKGRVRFVNDRTGYAFVQWWFAVTTDGGRRWSIWDVPAHLPGRAYYNPRLIDAVEIAGDGTGTMTLSPEGVVNKQRLVLKTNNFGVEWSAQ
jgi:hypothetical protein